MNYDQFIKAVKDSGQFESRDAAIKARKTAR